LPAGGTGNIAGGRFVITSQREVELFKVAIALIFRQMPEAFKIGKPLPVISLVRQKELDEAKTGSQRMAKSRSRRKPRAVANSRAASPFVHGCELQAIRADEQHGFLHQPLRGPRPPD